MSKARERAGFTLVEVMAALTIMSLIMVALYTALNTTLDTRDQLENEAKVARLGPGLLDIIEQDLRRIWVMNIEDDRVFLGESHTIDGEAADSLAFITTVNSIVSHRIDGREVTSDLCETGYRLRRNPLIPDLMELWRRQSFHIDEEPLQDGVYELLHPRVVSLQIRYLEEIDRYAEKFPDWDSSVRHRLPALVDIELAIEAVPRTSVNLDRRSAALRTLRYRRVIALGRDTDIAMRVHALPPRFAGAGVGNALDAAGAPGGGLDDTGGLGGPGNSGGGPSNPFQKLLDGLGGG